MKHKSTYYINKVKCLIEVYINFTSDFDRGHGPLIFILSYYVFSTGGIQYNCEDSHF